MDKIKVDIVNALGFGSVTPHGGAYEISPSPGTGDTLFQGSAVCHHKLVRILLFNGCDKLGSRAASGRSALVP